MTLALRLLRGYVGAIVPVPTATSLTFTGFWNNIAEPRAAFYNGKTYFGYVQDAGDIYVSSYDHTAHTTSTPFLVGTGFTSVDGDIHNGIAVLVRSSDHKILIVECSELAAHPFVRLTTNPEDVTAWDSASTFLSAGAYTYPTLYQLADGTIYLFLKYQSGSNYPLGFSKSTDGGTTWSAISGLVGPRTTTENYWRIYSDGGTIIHIFSTDTNRVGANSAVYHFRFDGTSLYKSDGTLVSGPYPTAADNGTLVQDASLGTAWAEGGSVSGAGNPGAVILCYDSANTKNLIRAAHWTGSSWSVSAITDSVGVIGGNKFIAGAAIDKTDPFTIWCNRKVGSHFELFRCRSLDSGTTWDLQPVTSGSSTDNAMPDTPYAAASGMQIVWGLGTYTNDSTYSFTVYGAGT